jgi:hypothetical protein
MKFSSRSQHVGLVLPLFLAATHDNSLRRHQFFKRLRVAGKPCAPYGFAGTQ